MPSSDSEVVRRIEWLIAAVLIATFTALAWALRAPGVTLTNDDAQYLLLSQSIRQLTYRELFLVGAPVHYLYPPGYPALLAAGSFIVGTDPERLLLVGIAAAIAGLVVLWMAVRQEWGAMIAAGTLALAALNPGLIHHAGLLLSEAPFFAFTVVAVWAASRQADRGMTAVAVVAAVGAAMTRAAGVTVVIAILLAWLIDRRWRAAMVLAVAAALTVAPWLAWSVTAPDQDPERSYASDAVATFGEYDPRARHSDSLSARPGELPASRDLPAALARRIATNARLYLTEELPWSLPAMTVPGTRVDNWLWLLAVFVFGVAGVRQLWRRWKPAAVLTACYGALLLVWPWAFSRFLVPVIPIALLTLLVGAVSVGRRLGRWGVALPIVFGILVGGEAISRNAQRLRVVAACDRAQATRSAACFGDDARSFFAASQYAAAVLAPQEAVAVRGKEATFAHFSGRKAVPIVVSDASGGQLLDTLGRSGAGYVLLSHLSALDLQLARAIAADCDRLISVESFPPQTWLFRLTAPSARDSTGSGCTALAEYLENPRPLGWKTLW